MLYEYSRIETRAELFGVCIDKNVGIYPLPVELVLGQLHHFTPPPTSKGLRVVRVV